MWYHKNMQFKYAIVTVYCKQKEVSAVFHLRIECESLSDMRYS